MRILISGGAGFIGSHAARLLARSHRVIAVDDLSSTGNWDNLCNAHLMGINDTSIMNVQRLSELIKSWKPDAVIHLAAQPSIQESWKKADYDAKVNILGTINLLGLCQKYKVKRFVFASTSAVYSPDTTGIYNEGYPTNPRTPYGVSKLAAEQYIKISGISYAILRLGNVYGPRQVPLGENQLIPRYLSHAFQGTDFVINGDGKQRRDYIYVKDVANAFMKAVESEETGIFNISSGRSFEVKDILALINIYLDENGYESNYDWKHGPAKEGELRNVTLENALAKHVFNWKPEVGIVEGLRETIAAWPKRG